MLSISHPIQWISIHIHAPQPFLYCTVLGKKVNLAEVMSGWNLAVVNSISTSCHIVSGHFIEEETISNRSVDAVI